MTDHTADAAKLRGEIQQILSPAIDPRAPYAKVMLDKITGAIASWNTRPQPAPPEGEPDFLKLADKFYQDPQEVYGCGPVRVMSAFGERMYHRGLAARPKVEDAFEVDLRRVKDIARLTIERDEAREKLAELEAKLAEREAELAKADAVIYSLWEKEATINQAERAELENARERHAARQQQKDDK